MAHVVNPSNIQFKMAHYFFNRGAKKKLNEKLNEKFNEKFNEKTMAQVPIVRCVGDLLLHVSEGRFKIGKDSVKVFPAGKGIVIQDNKEIPFVYVVYKVRASEARIFRPNIAICMKVEESWEVYSAKENSFFIKCSEEIFSNMEGFLSDAVSTEGVSARDWEPVRSLRELN